MGRVNQPPPPPPPQQQQPPPPPQQQDPTVLNHFSHSHPMQLINPPPPGATQILCNACKFPCEGGPAYHCAPCDYTLDKPCASFARVIRHPAHPDHPLTLSIEPTAYSSFLCNGCHRQGFGSSYYCSLCDYVLHPNCASLPRVSSHPSHPHALTLTFVSPYGVMPFTCDVCRQIGIGGSVMWLYRCVPCGFDAHVGCAVSDAQAPTQQPQQQQQPPQQPQQQQQQEPTVLNHFSHSHPMQLVNPPPPGATQILCNACKFPCEGGPAYRCSPCDYTLDKPCASYARVIRHPAHPDHPLTLSIEPTAYSSFLCDGCHSQGLGSSYYCSLCDYVLHPNCASLSRTSRHPSHPHALTLTFVSPYGVMPFTCDVCRQIGIGGSVMWLYRCAPCGFDVHLGCAVVSDAQAPAQQAAPSHMMLMQMLQRMQRASASASARPVMMNPFQVQSSLTRPSSMPPLRQNNGMNELLHSLSGLSLNNGMNELLHSLSGLSLNNNNGNSGFGGGGGDVSGLQGQDQGLFDGTDGQGFDLSGILGGGSFDFSDILGNLNF
ncbi:hypothetical protein QJS04_geneDACA009826 [Acorus gramineus]|uniref:Phorbol-ester/DAG-type domain-containing protein n=1 Tax=Acorus gramineus TaxID=55184 RepID=A0AAV9BEN8_ACOGR|nr:hypothetical protein QJS04_geneDACA009826 [Acorus gramineus]